MSCTKGNREMKIKIKWNLEVKYLFIKLFSRNLEFLVLCCDAITLNLGQKD